MNRKFALRLKMTPVTRRVSNPNTKALKRISIYILGGCLFLANEENW